LSVQPTDLTMIIASQRQHTATADKLARRIASCAGVVRKSLATGTPAQSAARQIITDVTELVAELARISEDARIATWVRQPAA
jgi:hypothetical protein